MGHMYHFYKKGKILYTTDGDNYGTTHLKLIEGLHNMGENAKMFDTILQNIIKTLL